MSCENNDLIEKLLECEKELKYCQNELDSWIDSLQELSIIKKAFKIDGKINLDKKTILDVGTDCVKPLYIALKFKPSPDKIIGIDEALPSIASDLKLKSKFLAETKIRFYNCSLFDNVTLDKILEKEGMGKFDFVLVSKSLHHLRTGKCIARKRDRKHDCEKDETEKNCIYEFKERVTFEKLLRLGTRVIVYEWFDPNEEDEDKIRGRGGYFTMNELKEIFKYLSDEEYTVKFISPKPFLLNKKTLNKVYSILRQIDCVCFYVEEAKKTN